MALIQSDFSMEGYKLRARLSWNVEFFKCRIIHDRVARDCYSTRVKCVAQDVWEVTAGAPHFAKRRDRKTKTSSRWCCCHRSETTAPPPSPQNGSVHIFTCEAGKAWAQWHFERACQMCECAHWFAKLFSNYDDNHDSTCLSRRTGHGALINLTIATMTSLTENRNRMVPMQKLLFSSERFLTRKNNANTAPLCVHINYF